MKALNQGLAFVLELCLLAALAYWGFHLDAGTAVQWLAGIGAPVGLAVVWGLVAAPRARRRLPPSQLIVFKLVVFTLGAALLYSTGRRDLAIAFGTLALVNLGLSAAWGTL
ncbi:MAG: YrdB family protein [Gaiellales bacterium]